MLRVMWRRGDSSLRRIYPSWEDLEANLDIVVDTENQETEFTFGSCPYCGAKQRIEKPKDEMTKEDALRILRALEDEEKNTEKNKKIPVEGTYKGKDW